jgi:hypothetical protein
MTSLNDLVPSGVVTGADLVTLLTHARDNNYAIPAVNCTRYVVCRVGGPVSNRVKSRDTNDGEGGTRFLLRISALALLVRR